MAIEATVGGWTASIGSPTGEDTTKYQRYQVAVFALNQEDDLLLAERQERELGDTPMGDAEYLARRSALWALRRAVEAEYGEQRLRVAWQQT